MLLQTALTGKAQKAYTTLSAEDWTNYDTVKKTILQSFELVPEAYRQKFRNQRKNDNQSFMEFVKEKERLMNKWYAAKMIGDDVENLNRGNIELGARGHENLPKWKEDKHRQWTSDASGRIRDNT